MKILLSASTYHFNPIDETYYHSTGLTVKVFYQALKRFGEIDVINDRDKVIGRNYDLLVSWPRNYDFLKRNNTFKKKICFLNAAEPNYLRRAMLIEAALIGCKVSDCFYFSGINDADLYFLLGREFNRRKYFEAGVPENKMFDFAYNTDVIPFKKRDKNKRTIFLHIATSLGLRKGFWHVVNDFKKTDIDAELWCVGKVQKEKFWYDFAKEAEKDKRIKIIGWVDFESERHINLMQSADFMVFPSLGEGQAGTVVESMSAGCIPISSEAAGVPYFPIGKYEDNVYERANMMSNDEFHYYQEKGLQELQRNYNNQYFIDYAIPLIENLIKEI